MTATNRFLALALLLGVGISCKKEADVAPPVVCQVQKIDYNDGTYETFRYDADGFVAEYSYFYPDSAGKSVAVTSTYTYNKQGLLDRVYYSPNGKPADLTSYEQFNYVNGALSTVELIGAGKPTYRFEMTTNANGQITATKGISFDKTNYPEYTGAFTLDAQNRYIKAEGTNADGVFYRFESGDFDPVVKTHYDSFKGWPINATNFWYNYGVATPINGAGSRRKHVFYSGYDDSGNFVGLRKVYDFTYTYKTNSNSYETELTINNVAKTPTTVDSRTTFTYTNCN